jgi:hypothetical protein
MRALYAVLGLVAVTWLALYLSSYGVLMRSETTPAQIGTVKIGNLDQAIQFGGNTLTCTYFIGTGFHTVTL